MILIVCYTKNLNSVTQRLQSRYSIYLSDSDWKALEEQMIKFITNNRVKPKADNHAKLSRLLLELKTNNPSKFRNFEDWLIQLILEFKKRKSVTSSEDTTLRKKKSKKQAIELQIYS